MSQLGDRTQVILDTVRNFVQELNRACPTLNRAKLGNMLFVAQDELDNVALFWTDPVISQALTTPPIEPQNEDRYLLSSPGDADTAWEGQVNVIAEWRVSGKDQTRSEWRFWPVQRSSLMWVNDESLFYGYNGATYFSLQTTGANGNVWQQPVITDDVLDPTPLTPSAGDRYLINGVGAGAWVGKDNNIAEWDGTVWLYTPPIEGMVTYVKEDALFYFYDGAAWGNLFDTIVTWVPPVITKSILDPTPLTPSAGDRYLIDGVGAGAWTGHDDEIAEWDGDNWEYTAPRNGMVTYVDDEDLFYIYDGMWLQWPIAPHAVTHENGGTDEIDVAGLSGQLADPQIPLPHAPTHEKDGTDEIETMLVDEEPMGFPDSSDNYTTISWNDGTQEFTIAPVGADFDIWVKSKKFTKNAPEVVDISGVIAEGVWFFYYDDTGTLIGSQTPWDLTQHAPVSYIQWDSTNSIAIFFADERHGLVMDYETHKYLHFGFGTQWRSGLTLTPKTTPIPGSGNLDADAEVELEDGYILDEDLEINIRDSGSGSFVQDIRPIAQLPVYYRDGAAGNWRKKPANNFPLIEAAYVGTGTRIHWNDPDGGGIGIWDFTELPNGDYMNLWLIGTNDIFEPLVIICGQADYNTLLGAELADISEIAWGQIPFQEIKILYKLIFETANGFSNSPKARLVEVIDYREIQTGGTTGGTSPTVHNSLSGRADTGAHPAAAVAPDVTNFNNRLTATEDDVQKALDVLDDYPFGLNLQQASSDALSTHTGDTNYQTKVSITTPVIPAGTYRVNYYFEWTHSDEAAGKEMKARVRQDAGGTPVDLAEVILLPRRANVGFYPASGFAYVTLTNAAHTFDLDYGVNDAGETASIRRARLELWRVG